MPDPVLRPRPIAGWTPKLGLALGSLLVLGLGALLAPRPLRDVPPPHEEKVAPILEAQVARREPGRVFRGVQDVGATASQYALAFADDTSTPRDPPAYSDYALPPGAASRLAAFGVMVSEQRDVLTHVGALRGRREVTVRLPDGSTASGRLLAYDRESGRGVALTPPLFATRPPRPSPRGGDGVPSAP